MQDSMLKAWIWIRTLPVGVIKDESGEGVISAAIAVLIMASLGALMWIGFKAIWGDVETNTKTHVQEIGN
jgi:hypothetical protein